MIISKIYGSLTDKQKEDFVWGLAAGLAGGLAVGLVWGLAAGLAGGLAGGLVGGLAVGLAVGLVWGLAAGLAGGLVWGLAAGLAVGLANGVLSPLWLFIPAIIILAEILFYFDKKKIGNRNVFEFTLERKAEALFESLLIITNLMNLWVLSQKVDFYAILKSYCPVIVQAIYVIGLVALGVTCIAVWVWLNSLRYHTRQKQPEDKRRMARSEEWKKNQSEGLREYWRKKKGGR